MRSLISGPTFNDVAIMTVLMNERRASCSATGRKQFVIKSARCLGTRRGTIEKVITLNLCVAHRNRCKLQTESRTVHCTRRCHCAHVRVPLGRLPTRFYPDGRAAINYGIAVASKALSSPYLRVNITYSIDIGMVFRIGALQLQLHIFQNVLYFRSGSCIFQGFRHNVAAGRQPRFGIGRVE